MNSNVTALITAVASILTAYLSKYGLDNATIQVLLTAIVGAVGAILTHHQADQEKQIAVASVQPTVAPASKV